MIKIVDSLEEAKMCDGLLTKLIRSEKEFNENILSSFIVNNWYEKYYLDKSHKLFIEKVGDKVVAYIHIMIFSEDGPTKELEAMIDGLYVEDEFRKQGIATRLIDEAITWAKSMNVKYITLKVLDKNEVAKSLYKNLAFTSFEQVLRKEL